MVPDVRFDQRRRDHRRPSPIGLTGIPDLRQAADHDRHDDRVPVDVRLTLVATVATLGLAPFEANGALPGGRAGPRSRPRGTRA